MTLRISSCGWFLSPALPLDGGKPRWLSVDLKPLAVVAVLLVPINAASETLYGAESARPIEDHEKSFIDASAATEAAENSLFSFWPWKEEAARQPPKAQPYKIPTLHGDKLNFKAKPPPLVKAPNIDADAVYEYVLACYPAASKWNLDVNLRAQLANSPETNILSSEGTSTTELGSNYVAIVANLPLYSSTELNREKEREAMRRQATATIVADFISAIASRNHAIRELALYRSLETRAALRVQQGISEAKEQMAYLEKVATSRESLIKQEAKIMESRLKLSGLCDPVNAKVINTWLKNISAVPQEELAQR